MIQKKVRVYQTSGNATRALPRLIRCRMCSLNTFLTSFEPSICRPELLRLLTKRGKLAETHERLSNLLEHIAGYDPMKPLFGGKRADEIYFEEWLETATQ